MELSEIGNISQVIINNEISDVEKIEQLNDKKNNKIISDPEAVAVLDTADFSDSVKLQKIYGMSIDTLYQQRITAPSVYSTMSQDKILDSTTFKKILGIMYDDTIDEPSNKIILIKLLNITDPYLLPILDNPTTSDNVKLFGKELDGEELITSDSFEENFKNPPPIPSSNNRGKKGKKGKKKKK